MDRPAACGRGDGCYYCETSGSGHSVLRTIKATKLFSIPILSDCTITVWSKLKVMK
ncbi:hypothetical protein BDA96_05G165300 [Sorghum bicolor]|uniref:Uncharacterized protein n=1 Tax=Sorghum bicolor TaxID=4558 RepID=A0A921UFY0_SORBI|nr:hypothetical protein BDA96_05G165300 [Sorghum bicolor]